jgi:tetratricopeptide (TPR) repeat protein
MKSFVATIIAVLIVLPLSAEMRPRFEDLVKRAVAANAQNDFRDAIKLYSRALLLRPNWAEGWLRIGLLKYQTGSYAGARNDLTHFISLTHDPEPAVGIRGLCEFQTGEYAKSLKDIQLALSFPSAEADEEKEVLVYHEALLLTKLGKFVEALNEYTEFVISLLDQRLKTLELLTRVAKNNQWLALDAQARSLALPNEGATERILRYETHLDR